MPVDYPRYAIHPSFGKCRVISINGDSVVILTKKDRQIQCNRNILVFTNR